MAKKLLVITAGTVAAEVGQTILKQMKAHPNSDLNIMVRYIDTAYLPARNGALRQGEWFQMSINERFMSAIHDNIENYPRLERMLFSGLLPGTDVSGGGSIRYNGAGAVEVKREELRKWLSASMTELARSGDGDTNVSIALILSAVGATGSGSLEHLVDVIVDAANYANVKSTSQATIRCDVYIMQPSQDVTDLGLANTLALYSELAATQLSQSTSARNYQGRKIMIGWGSHRALSSIEQLKEAAATIIRLSSDPSSTFAAEFQEREVDNHVLRELDPLTSLPMHLSLVTVITINLGRLEEVVIERDVARLIDSLVFDKTEAGTSSDILLGKLADSLAGENADDRYSKLIEYLSEGVGLGDMRKRLDAIVTRQGIPAKDKSSRLMKQWQESKDEIKQSRHRIQDYARTFVSGALEELERSKGERIYRGGISLTELREEYSSLQIVLANVLRVAREDVRTSVSDEPVIQANRALDGIWPFKLMNRSTKLRRLSGAMNRNLQDYLQESTRSAAITALDKLEQYCAEVVRNLDVVLGKLRRQRENQQKNSVARDFSVDAENQLNMVALKSAEEMSTYASTVSLFSADTQVGDQLAEFRQWLQSRPELDTLFKGDLALLLGVVTRYAKEKVQAAIRQHSVLDILRQAGEDTLRKRLFEAAARATPLVSYSEDFALSRREAWHVSAYYKNEEEREDLQSVINLAFAQGQCKLLFSSDPAEIAVFYYVDGIPMSAVDDMKGRCLEAFLKRRQQWQKQKASLNGHTPTSSMTGLNQRVGVPIFSGQDAENRVQETGVVKRLYSVRGKEVGEYKAEDVPELAPKPAMNPLKAPTLTVQNGNDDHNNGNGAGNNNGNDGGSGPGNGGAALNLPLEELNVPGTPLPVPTNNEQGSN